MMHEASSSSFYLGRIRMLRVGALCSVLSALCPVINLPNSPSPHTHTHLPLARNSNMQMQNRNRGNRGCTIIL
jgi:hypothetical protein